MKLRQNAKELVLVEIDGLGLLLGQIRYNRQTETAIFALEKAAFFDLYFPCTVVYDQQKGPVVHPHILAALTNSSIRVQRSRVSCFIMEQDLNLNLIEQYNRLVEAVMAQHGIGLAQEKPSDEDPSGPKPGGGKRVIPLSGRKDKS